MMNKVKIFFWILFLFSTGLFSQEILISDGGTVNTCSGTFYDSGGPSGVYGANEDFTITICPENDAQVIELDFQSFTTQPVQNGNGDGLIIYNGDSTSAEEFGMFSGTSASSSPGFIVADNPSGCLTIQFFSNGAAQASGWEATISCFEPCQDVTAAIDSNPGVNIDGSIEVDLDQTIDFTGIGGFSSGNANNATYEWNLDDGTILFGENVQHSYSTAGLYNVTLLITDYNDNNKFAVLSDILGDEDHLGDMDFKVAGTMDGITSLQMDIKITSITKEIMEIALNQASGGRKHIIGVMSDALPEARTKFSKHAPQVISITIDKAKIKDVIGSGGKVIKNIVEVSGAKLEVNDDGIVKIASSNEESINKAKQMVEDIVAEPEVGKVYTGKVVKIVEFGAFVNFMGARDGLLHVSLISQKRVENVSDVLSEGQEVQVKVLDVDRAGKVKLSMKEV